VGFATAGKQGLAGAGASIVGGQSNASMRSQAPFSFKAAID